MGWGGGQWLLNEGPPLNRCKWSLKRGWPLLLIHVGPLIDLGRLIDNGHLLFWYNFSARILRHWEFDNWPLNKGLPLNRGSTVFIPVLAFVAASPPALQVSQLLTVDVFPKMKAKVFIVSPRIPCNNCAQCSTHLWMRKRNEMYLSNVARNKFRCVNTTCNVAGEAVMF